MSGVEGPGELIPRVSPEQYDRGVREATGRFPIEGERIIGELDRVRKEDLPGIIEKAFAFQEGLFFNPEVYKLLRVPQVLSHLETLFISSEGAAERAYSIYLKTAIQNRLDKEIDDVMFKGKTEGRELSREEEDEIGRWMGFENARRGRMLIDVAFIQRMKTCEQSEKVVELLSQGAKPDKGHWSAALSGEFGEKVDRALRRIVAAGIDPKSLDEVRKRCLDERKSLLGKRGASQEEIGRELSLLEADMQPVPGVKSSIYADGFKNSAVFEKWLSHVLKGTDGRIDAAWFAWKLALTWEIPTQLGLSTEGGKYEIADPPIGSDLFVWTIHINEKRAAEWGLTPDGRRYRTTRYLTHSGYPISVNTINGPLCEEFLHFSKVKDKKAGGRDKDVSLWKLWWERGMKVGGKNPIEILPWEETELQPRGQDTAELAPGSFGYWFLTRMRARTIVEDLRSTPSLRDIADPNFFNSRNRNWEKVLGTYEEFEKKTGREMLPEENPKAWWVLGLLLGHSPNPINNIPVVRSNPSERLYRTVVPGETYGGGRRTDVDESRRPSTDAIFNHAWECGFLRQQDIEWIMKQAGISAPPSPERYKI